VKGYRKVYISSCHGYNEVMEESIKMKSWKLLMISNPSQRCFFLNFWCPEKSEHETLFTNIMMK
jgi:hypothetical protein